MGSDTHYPEEAPAHRVSVDGFWIDRTPVTNSAQFKQFVRATGHVTFAEKKPFSTKDYPNALPHFTSCRFAGFRYHLAIQSTYEDWSPMVEAGEGRQLATPVWS